MRKFLASFLLMAVTSASAQSSWSTSQFTVSSPVFMIVDIVGGTVEVAPDLTGAVSNAGGGSYFPPMDIDLLFQAQPGYRLEGEMISFGVDMTVDTAPGASTMVLPAIASFKVDINGEYSSGNSNSGGKTHDVGSYLLHAPMLSAAIDESVQEGVACPAGHDDNNCNFGIDLVFLQAEVEPGFFNVTPILVAVPEPDTAALSLAALVAFGLARRCRG